MKKNPDRALIFPRGCAETSDLRQRESHAVRRVRPDALRPVRGLGALSASGARPAPTEPKARPPTSASEIPLVTLVIGTFGSLGFRFAPRNSIHALVM